MNPIAEDILMHYGTPKRSGRYPWGSGEQPYQHSGDFLSRIEELKNQGLGDTEIAKAMGLTTTQFRAQKSLAKDERRSIDVATAKSLRDKGYSLNAIAEKMGYTNDSSVRSLANTVVTAKKQDNPDMTTSEIKKASQQALTKARIEVGAKRETIKLTDKAWEAVQAGAISENVLKEIINNVDIDIDGLTKRFTFIFLSPFGKRLKPGFVSPSIYCYKSQVKPCNIQ